MKLIAVVEGEKFNVSCGNGKRDLAWLAQLVAKMYSRKLHPSYNFMPILLYTLSKEGRQGIPHPRWSISDIFEEGNTFYVDLRKQKTFLEDKHRKKDWLEQAYGKLRSRMICKWSFGFIEKPSKEKRLIGFKIKVDHQKFVEVKEYSSLGTHEYEMDYDDMRSTNDTKYFRFQKDFPFGEVKTLEISAKYSSLKDSSEFYEPKSEKNTSYMVNYEFNCTPKPISEKHILDIDHKAIEEQMNMPDVKPEDNTSESLWGRCPYTLDQVWKSIDWIFLPEMHQQKCRKFLMAELDRIYEIFYHYSQFHVQDAETREDVGITWQDVFLVLKFYSIMPTGTALVDFTKKYNQTFQKYDNFADTLSMDRLVRFPEFINVLVRGVYTAYREEFDEESKDAEESVFDKHLGKMISIHANDEEFTDFQRHMFFSSNLVEFLRNKSQVLKTVFLKKLDMSLQAKMDRYYALRQDLYAVIVDIVDNGYEGENIDDVLVTCFNEITPGEKYHGYEGLFYYEFLQALQWLSLVFIQRKDENPESTEEEISEETLLEKFTYLVDILENKLANTASDKKVLR